MFACHRTALAGAAMGLLPELLRKQPWVWARNMTDIIYLADSLYVVIQIESLCRLCLQNCELGEIGLILDECNSINRQLESQCGDYAKAQSCFEILCENAHVLSLDGFLDQDRINVLRRYTKSEVYTIENTFMRLMDQV